MTRSISAPATEAPPALPTIESRASWVVAGAVLAILFFSFGSPYLVAVGMRPIAEELGSARWVPSLAASLAWFGGGVGGMLMGWLAEKVGVRWTVLVGAVMVGIGLVVSTLGGAWALWLGHGLFLGLLGNGGINVPLMTYVTRWFDRHRGSALALIASGQYISGVVWPGIFAQGMSTLGWRTTMAIYGGLVMIAIIPLAIAFLRAPPAPIGPHIGTLDANGSPRAVAHPNRVFFALLCCAPFMCCVPMAIPQGHLVAFCGDLGISAAHGAAMLSLMLGSAFIARQVWGWLSDRIGGMMTVLVGSACQLAALVAFLQTQDERGLYIVAAAFGLGFSGLIPAYVLAVRDLFPASEAGWRVPVVFFAGTGGMAFGGWLAGAIYDQFGSYSAAWSVGIAINAAHFVLVGSLILWWRAARAK